MRVWALPLLMYAALACVFGVLGVVVFGVPRALDLAEHAVVTEGLIVEPTCENHDTVVYRYRANGRVFQANNQTAEVDCTRVNSNDRVRVWYTPNKPQRSSLQVPGDVLSNDLITVAVMALIAPVWILFWVIWRAFRPRKSSSPAS